MTREMVREITFMGKRYFLVGEEYGPIVEAITDFTQGRCSFAYLYEDGTVSRFNSQIGTIDDIEFGEEREVRFDEAVALSNMASDSSWPFNRRLA